tara:strand:- start:226 stop:417 length:192 start_codon:yes stop_codon:yes gene_type:complete
MEKDKNKSEEEQPWILESEVVKRVQQFGLDQKVTEAENKTERLVALTEVFSKHYSNLQENKKS